MNLDRTIAPQVKDFDRLSIPSCRHLILDNGIKLNIVDHGEFDVNRLSISWIGGAYDVDSFASLMLACDLMREGTKFHSGAEIAETLDYNGAWLKSNHHTHHTELTLHSLNSKFSEVLPILVESITSPSFPQQEFEINREKIARRKEINLSKVAYLSNQSNQRLIYGVDHPCAQDESPLDVRNISIDNIRAIHRDIFVADGCELFLAGRITPAIEDALNKWIGSIPTNQRHLAQRVIPLSPSSQKLDIVNVDDALQCAITMSIPTIPRSHPDYIDLRYVIMALGGYFGSRLMNNIREDKGYTYGISAALLGNWEGGVATIATQCDNAYAKAVIEEVKNEIELLKLNNFDKDELTRLKRYAMTQIAGTLDSPFSIMDYYENQRHVLTPDGYFQAMQLSLNNLDSQRIASLATKYINIDELRISISGDKTKINITE